MSSSKRYLFCLLAFCVCVFACGCSARDDMEELNLILPQPDVTAENVPQPEENASAQETVIPEESAQPEPAEERSEGTAGTLISAVYEGNVRECSGIAGAETVVEFLSDSESSGVMLAFFRKYPQSIGPLGSVNENQHTFLASYKPEILYCYGQNVSGSSESRSSVVLNEMGIDLIDGACANDPNMEYKPSEDSFYVHPKAGSETITEAFGMLDFNENALPFSRMAYTIIMGDRKYLYDESSCRYEQQQDGALSLDAERNKTTVSNLVFLRTKITESGDPFISMNESSMGEADIFSQGSGIYGKWFWDQEAQSLKITDDNGKVLSLIPGNTWIHVISENASVDFE